MPVVGRRRRSQLDSALGCAPSLLCSAGPDWRSLLGSTVLILAPVGERGSQAAALGMAWGARRSACIRWLAARPLASTGACCCRPLSSWRAVVFCAWVLPWVGVHISWALVGISAALIVFSQAMLAATAFTDPGFIPRSPPDSDVEYG